MKEITDTENEFDFFDPGPGLGMVALPVVDLKAMECRIRDNIRNAGKRLFRKTMIFAASFFAAAFVMTKFL